ncbi:MAG: TIGR00300 family protein [Pirellulaceae bacterium]|nr:TIGR00300 family protein [Pirellulaceae bacterium]
MSTVQRHATGTASGDLFTEIPQNKVPASSTAAASQAARFVEDVEVRGHIIDSLILPKILDCITGGGGTFRIREITIGQAPTDASHALIEVGAADEDVLKRILALIANHGAVPITAQDCRLVAADISGTFPEGFYSTTNQRTEVRPAGRWLPVRDQAMDSAILVERERTAARCVRLSQVRPGDAIVVGHAGVRVFPEERARGPQAFEFMGSNVSTEKPKGVAIRRIAQELVQNRASGGKTLVVAGPAVVHTDSGQFLCWLIRQGYVDLVFAGNALATHDVEQALFGTSLGVYLDRGSQAEAGHAHHLRAINRIRRAGGIRQAVENGWLASGIMYECIRHGTEFLLAGSIRDDGPLPEVITDTLQAQMLMREKLPGVTFCLMLATTLHSVAVANLLPAWVKVVCVDINPSTAIKLADRGSFQTVALVTDVAPFLRALTEELAALKPCHAG